MDDIEVLRLRLLEPTLHLHAPSSSSSSKAITETERFNPKHPTILFAVLTLPITTTTTRSRTRASIVSLRSSKFQ
ncbi:hypothetical protein VNO80_19436 [Phaseolus coccineus]|uniref:Uncharacterized protein n=1 Tax=Phaseolus coccineus TaxID=3886 RepID=A0AAN9MG12_PHACN